MKLNYKEFGQGDPVIILHGMFGTLDNWQTIAKQLAKNYSVYIIDQRNHGRSPHSDAFSYTLMAEDLHEFMESNWMYKASIMGHSMGGKTAMEFALNYPDMVDKLIVVDIAPKRYEGGHQAIFDALLSLDLETIKTRKEAEAFLKTRINDLGIRQFLLKNLTRTKEGDYQWKMNLKAIHTHYQAILDALESDENCLAESLFIRGEKSNYVQDADMVFIQTLFPNSRLTTVEKAGHWVHAEAPKILLEKVQTFLNS